MNENIKAGVDLHAGDGGYSIGTQKKYEEFAKARNYSMGKDEYIKFLEDRLKHQTEQTEKAMEMLAKLMGKLK